MRRESFENFYYTKIGLAEGCGCAEHVTRMRDIDDLAAVGAFEAGTVRSPSQLCWAQAAISSVFAAVGRWAVQRRSRDIRI